MFASKCIIELLRNKGVRFSKAIKSFDSLLTLNVGDRKVYAVFYGEGHARDNIIGYFPEDSVTAFKINTFYDPKTKNTFSMNKEMNQLLA